jgi:hypothetical protein
MALRSGIPTLAEVDDLLRGDLFRAHREFNAAFLKQHDAVMRRYARAWVYDVFGPLEPAVGVSVRRLAPRRLRAAAV